jgi:hypothetical protein
MGEVYHSCGHECSVRPVSGFPITTKEVTADYESGEVPCLSHRTLCHSCYLHYVEKYPETVVFDSWEEESWLGDSGKGIHWE